MAQQAKRVSGLTIKKTYILFALVPLSIGLIILGIVSAAILTRNIEGNIREELEIASVGLKEYYTYDLESETNLVDGFCEYAPEEYIDKIASNTGIDLTLFNKNIRFMTSIIGSDGKRIEGTAASQEVWSTVSAGNDFYNEDVVINGIDYYVYYLPLEVNGSIVGMAFSGKPATSVKASERQLRVIIICIVAVLESLFLILAIVLSKKISGTINEVKDNIEMLSNGNIDLNIDIQSHVDETTTLVASAKRLSEILKKSISGIKSSAETLKVSMETTSSLARESSLGTAKITKAMDGLAIATGTMSESVMKVNSNIGDMGNMIDGIVSSAEKLGDSSTKMSKAGDEATKCIKEMSASSSKSFEAIKDITEMINSTNESIKKISEIVDLITGVASQTNLLSLNASIEASRAGEAGRGFGVVATEIKTLAEQSGSSAEKILSVVKEITEQSEACVKKSDEVRSLIENEQSTLELTRNKFSILEEEIGVSISEISTVSRATEQLNSAKNMIINAVSDLSAISQETAATNQEVTASIATIKENVDQVSSNSDRLNELSDELKESVAYFK
ncbi:MAG: cache domain-containing protein [Lachnospiraceae bacterium]|nr:cache domain-containing protein [Lachnospiraceae bacterium]